MWQIFLAQHCVQARKLYLTLLSPGGRKLQESMEAPWDRTKLVNCFVLSHQSQAENCLSTKPLHAPFVLPTSYFSTSFCGWSSSTPSFLFAFHWPPDSLIMASLHTSAVLKLRGIKFQFQTQWQVHPFLLCWWKKNNSCPTRTIKFCFLWLAVSEQPCINVIYGDPRGGICYLLSALLHTPEFDRTLRRMIKATINLSK